MAEQLTREDVAEVIKAAFDDFAPMVQRGFADHRVRLDGIDGRLDGIDGRLDSIEGRLDRLEVDVKEIKAKLDDIVTIAQFRSLIRRVEALEDRKK